MVVSQHAPGTHKAAPICQKKSSPLPVAEGTGASLLTYTCSAYLHIQAHHGLQAPSVPLTGIC